MNHQLQMLQRLMRALLLLAGLACLKHSFHLTLTCAHAMCGFQRSAIPFFVLSLSLRPFTTCLYL
jgi:hypothetical protein